jgi:hypothetical protein
MSFRDEVDALAARHASLEQELAEKTREVADSAQLLDEARTKRNLPILDNIRVASPCPASWDQMVGDHRTRHCGDCNKSVYNLSGMTRDEAEALVIENNGNLCVRYYQRADGGIMLADCVVGVSNKRKRRLVAAGAAALLAGGGLGARAVVMSNPDRLAYHREAIQGGIALPPPPPVADNQSHVVMGGGAASFPEQVMGGIGPPPPPPKAMQVMPKHKAPPHKELVGK